MGLDMYLSARRSFEPDSPEARAIVAAAGTTLEELECRAPVHAEQLAHLRDACKKAVEAYEAGDLRTAAATMAPRPGFFFGSTDVDDSWASDLRHTITEIERVVNTVGACRIPVEFTYQSSW